MHGLLYRLQDKQEVASQHRMIKSNNTVYEWLRKIRVTQIQMYKIITVNTITITKPTLSQYHVYNGP